MKELLRSLPALAARVRHLETAEGSGIPAAHATSHQNGGSDEISVAGLSGVLADRQDADKLLGRALGTTAPSDGQLLKWDNTTSKWIPSLAPCEIRVGVAACSSDLSVDSTWRDITGCAKTLTIPSGGQTILVLGVFVATASGSNNRILQGALSYDGTRHTRYAKWSMGYNYWAMGTQTWIVNLAAGNKEIKLECANTGGSGENTIKATHTAMLWMRVANMTLTDES